MASQGASVPVERGRADVNGTTLQYEIAGAGDAVVFTHGFGSDLRSWEPQLEVFSRRYRVLRYDARGFGKSAVPTAEPYGHYDDLRALLEYFGIGSAHVIGRSRGGGISVNFALTYPEMVRKLVLVSCSPGPAEASRLLGSPQGSGYDALVQTARREGIDAARELYRRSQIFAAARERPDLVPVLDASLNDYTGWHWLHDDPHVDLDPPAPQRLSSIGAPTLLFVGGRDAELFHLYADLLQRDIPDVRRVDVPSAGHMINLEEPAEFNRVTLDFLG